MASQVTTAAAQVDKERLGYQAISIDSLTATTAITIKAGSKVEVGGALYDFTVDETESGGTWAGIGPSNTVYCYIVPAGASTTWIYSTSAPTWDVAKQGWYNGTSRCWATLYKDSGGLYQAKSIVKSTQTINVDVVNANSPDIPLGRLHHLPLGNTTTRQLGGGDLTPTAAGNFYASAITTTGVVGIPIGAKAVRVKVLINAYATAAGCVVIRIAFSDNNSNNPTNLTSHPISGSVTYNSAAGLTGYDTKELDIPINTSGQFYMFTVYTINCTVANSLVELAAVGYYMGD